MTLEEKFSYIRRNYGDIPVKLIAEDLGMSPSAVSRTAHRLGIRIPPSDMRTLKCMSRRDNPNPVTYTTKLLICRYYSEGSSINLISYLLGRPRSVIEEILHKCQNDGFYDAVNGGVKYEKEA